MPLMPVWRVVTWLTTFAALIVAIAVAGARLDGNAERAAVGDDPVYLPRAEYLRPLSLGWQNAVADVLWFRTISYFGQHYGSDRTYPWLASMCDLVTDLDPRALHVYRFAGVVLPWEADQVDAGIRLLEKGLRQFPDSWLLHYYLGFNYFFFKGDNGRALAQLRRAMAVSGSHPQIARLATVLAAHQYGPETTLAFLAQLHGDVDSAEVRQVIEDQARQVRLAADLERLDETIAAFQTRRGVPPRHLQELVEAGVLDALPEEPFGGHYEIDPVNGRARSSNGRVPPALRQSEIRERARRGESVRDL
jgi:hypothetical protein